MKELLEMAKDPDKYLQMLQEIDSRKVSADEYSINVRQSADQVMAKATEDARRQAEASNQQHTALLQDANAKAAKIIADAQDNANRILSHAQSEADRNIRNSEAALSIANEKAIDIDVKHREIKEMHERTAAECAIQKAEARELLSRAAKLHQDLS